MKTTPKLIGKVTKLAWIDIIIALIEALMGPKETSNEMWKFSFSYLKILKNVLTLQHRTV